MFKQEDFGNDIPMGSQTMRNIGAMGFGRGNDGGRPSNDLSQVRMDAGPPPDPARDAPNSGAKPLAYQKLLQNTRAAYDPRPVLSKMGWSPTPETSMRNLYAGFSV